MNTCAVTIAGPDRRVDLVVSTETPIGELIPTFVELRLDGAPSSGEPAPVWSVAPPGQQPLPLDRTLGQCGVADGAVLALTEVRSVAMAPPKPAEAIRRPEVRRGTPRERTQAALPERLGTGGAARGGRQGVLRPRARAAAHRVPRPAAAQPPRAAHPA